MQSKAIILIVDDEPANQRLLESILRSSDYQLDFASDGEEALTKASELKPDLILLDLMLPKVDGFEICRRLRAHPELGPVPIIMVTALDDRDARQRAIEAGADDLLSKPVDRSEVRMRVKSVTRLNRYRRFLEERFKFERIAELAPEGYLILDSQGNIAYANPQACRILDLNQPSPNAISFLERLQLEFELDTAQGGLAWQDAVAPGRRIPFRVVKPETENHAASWLQVDILSADGSGSRASLIRLVDVTAEVLLQRDLWKFHTQLSHKLRTPLVGLSGSFDLLTSDESLQVDRDQRELLDISRACLGQLRNHVEDILQYLDASNVGRAENTLPIGEVEEVIKNVAKEAELKTVDVSIPPELLVREVKFSRKAFELSITELFENSRKFHPRGCPILRITLSETPSRQLRIRVEDNGQRIPTNRLGKVWMPYYQSEKFQTGEVSGMGLGLSMIASMVREQGGSCELRNRSDIPGVAVELNLNFRHDK